MAKQLDFDALVPLNTNHDESWGDDIEIAGSATRQSSLAKWLRPWVASTESVRRTSTASSRSNIAIGHFGLGHLQKRGSKRLLRLLLTCAALLAALALLSSLHVRDYVERDATDPLWHIRSRLLDSMAYIKSRPGWSPPPVELAQHENPLGPSADASFLLGASNLKDYYKELEHFIITELPLSDGDASNPDSLLSVMRTFYPNSARSPAPIPESLQQKGRDETTLEQHGEFIKAWRRMMPKLNATFHDELTAEKWVRERFRIGGSASSGGQQTRGVLAAWDKLAEPLILRTDFFRYLILATDGGVYADTDVEPLRPIKDWCEQPSWHGNRPKDFVEPSLIVGIESDVGKREDWQKWWPRPLQITQWTMAATRGHPVMIDVVRRIVLATQDPTRHIHPDEGGDLIDIVMNLTGPGVWTDAVLTWLKVRYGIEWTRLKAMPIDGWQHHDANSGEWGETRILQITGFSPGLGAMDSHSTLSKVAMVRHHFKGTWKTPDSPGPELT